MRRSSLIEKIRRLSRELSDRKVYRVAVAYLAIGFVVVQLADLAAGAFGLPSWFEPLVWTLLGLGFPLALVVAWAFEVTGEGIRRAPRAGPFEERFLIDEEVCAALDRSRLDPRVVGNHLTYLDNHARSDVLVCYIHGFGLDAGEYRDLLRDHPHRAIAPTYFGFEPGRSERIALEYPDHVSLLREFLRRFTAEVRPRTTVLVGMSSGADMALHIAGDPGPEPPPVDGILALGPNLGPETVFVTRVFAHLEEEEPTGLPDALGKLSASASSLEEWLMVHEYLLRTLRKFRDDLEPLRRMATGLVRPYEEEGIDAFIRYFRAASEQAEAVLCVVADVPIEREPLERVKMKNLDEGVLGPRFRPGSLRVDRGVGHFELDDPERQGRHLDDLLEMLGVEVPDGVSNP